MEIVLRLLRYLFWTFPPKKTVVHMRRWNTQALYIRGLTWIRYHSCKYRKLAEWIRPKIRSVFSLQITQSMILSGEWQEETLH